MLPRGLRISVSGQFLTVRMRRLGLWGVYCLGIQSHVPRSVENKPHTGTLPKFIFRGFWGPDLRFGIGLTVFAPPCWLKAHP